jgi:predicted ATPase/DNA-binding CsgD family transcriptional regulator
MMSNPEGVDLYDPLTVREQEILTGLAAGLSDQQIAQALYLSANTVRWYNRQIYSKLGVATRTQAVARAKEMGLFGGSDNLSPRLTPGVSLPRPATPFIGRDDEIASVTKLFQSTRLLTLTGVGGTGKTRLALRVASEMGTTFADGVYFVDLAPVRDAAMVANAIATALNILEHPKEALQATLIRVLAARDMLLLLDNFEHVINTAPLLSELLAATSALKLMVTSREALRLSGEQEYPVPPLSLPPVEMPSTQKVITSEAGALFLQRATMANPHFTLDHANAPAVAQICRRLDGLPLAIELAAVRCKVLTAQMLLERLERPLSMLTGGVRDAPDRQRTLQNTIEWSYTLLNIPEKRLFGRIALFSGGCSLEAVESVCGDSPETDRFDVLASLVDKSLIQQKETVGGEPRFVMLETIREYARKRLEEDTEYDRVRRRYVTYFVSLAERAEPEMRLAGQKRWFQLLEAEQENLRTVLAWALREECVTDGVRIAGALSWYWYVGGHHVEGLQWTERLLPLLDLVTESYHAKFLIGAAHMMMVRNFDTHIPLLEQALAVARRHDDRHYTAYALIRLGYSLMETAEAVPTVEAGLALFREIDYAPGLAHALTIMGEIYRFGGDNARARQLYEEALGLYHRIGDIRGTLITLLNLTFVARHQNRYEHALALAQEALRFAHELGLRAEMVECLAAVAGMIGATGQPQFAACLFGTVESAMERLGAFYDAPDRQEFDGMVAAIRMQLDPTDFENARIAGRHMTLVEAIESALHELPR